eukprot:gnl/TRDRNA2_/TRDRNA2_178480_c0_seq1.p1 gnl/TRDRNA2_/TRDRNA2_178480_c0~~gnl/TRDRNA2_/TRDRNA2_178480_c0_seq1.p1  ORF type:complete len:287 (+),score=35.58 gnl/TRDRNA2_/TRDRNA2_178480_c0_seq1:78-938(+)
MSSGRDSPAFQASAAVALNVPTGRHAHVPKRAVGFSYFLPGYEVLPCCLKPGQEEQLRKNFYTDEAKVNEETYITEQLTKGSVYQTAHSVVQPEDYYEPRPPIRPTECADSCGHIGTAHWKSTTHAQLSHEALQGAKYKKQFGPGYKTSTNPPTCVGRPEEQSQYQEDFGRYGSNPRDKVPPASEKMPNQKTVLAAGTTKGTNHMPGYSGFLATNERNPHVNRLTEGKSLRNSTDKTNLTSTFHANLVSYMGHVPTDAKNDNFGHSGGGDLTTTGRSFGPPLRIIC